MLPGQAYAAIVRSRHAHGVLRGINTAAALGMPGVLAVITGSDLAAAGYGSLKCLPPLKNRDGSPMRKPPRPALAIDKVRFVGDPVACVVADTAFAAKEAAEAVGLDIEPPSPGAAHLLRHSLATALLWKGAALEDIAAILRHCSMETTQIYAKVDIPALRKIAQPWPEA
jgi:xanthine dehydrogenase molybdopterin-binding subunit B